MALRDEDPDETLAAADESVRLAQAGAGDTTYSPALAIGATIRDARRHRLPAPRKGTLCRLT